MSSSRFAVGKVSDFAENSMQAVTLGDQEILLIHQEGQFYALPNQCTHARYPLADGELLDGKVKCQYHGATYDLKTGKPTLPAVKKIRLFTTETDGDDLFVILQEA
ncbi:MAG: Rieske 2Fe-2S domain-containing protein [Trueperaceae bacterium]|nr:Rieske 2Fe-2S domain-containing protein [Trueperaceae bacterium]